MGYDQREPLEEFFKQKKIEDYNFYKDLAGLDRGFIIKYF
jgi:release factor glutamine methyltransferase